MNIGADEPLGIPSESPARWIALVRQWLFRKMAFVSAQLEFLPFLRFLRDIITSVGTVIRNLLRRFTLIFD